MSRNSFTRRQVLAAAAAMAGMRRIDAASLPDLVPGNLVSTNELWKWLEQLAAWCPAYTGSPGHVKFVNFLEEKLHEAKLTPQRKTFKFPYWELKGYGLRLGDEKIHAASYRPYSGPTPASGVTAPLYFAGTAPKLDYSAAAGKIVVIEMPPAPGKEGSLQGELIGTYPANSTVPFVRYGVIGVYRNTPDLKQLEQAKAAGVIYMWNNVSDGNAEDQALPFSAASSPVPALWVNATTGKRLKQAAASDAQMTLTLDAAIHPDTPTDNLWAILPGKTDETIIINTHTDGCNACEENGGLGVVALAKYFSKIPQAQRNRTLVFLMTTGHFGHGYVPAARDWRQTNPDLMKKAVACVTIEHLAANEWVDAPEKNEYKASGGYDWGVAYTPLRPEGAVFLNAIDGTEAKHTYAWKPAGAYPGEGAGFWAAGIPALSYIPSPQYLFIAPAKGGGLEKLDRNRLHGEVTAFARAVTALDKMSVAEIKGV